MNQTPGVQTSHVCNSGSFPTLQGWLPSCKIKVAAKEGSQDYLNSISVLACARLQDAACIIDCQAMGKSCPETLHLSKLRDATDWAWTASASPRIFRRKTRAPRSFTYFRLGLLSCPVLSPWAVPVL